MKLRPILPAAGLLLLAGGIVQLFLENAELRRQLASSPASQDTPPPRSSVPAVPKAFGTLQPSPIAGSTPAGKPKITPLPVEKNTSGAAGGSFTSKIISSTPNGEIHIQDANGGPGFTLNPAEAARLAQEVQSTLEEQTTKFPNGPSWSPGQAAGPPNTESHGDFSTAWASQSSDGGAEWLKVKFANPVEVGEINIHESFNPGAVSKVSVILPDGAQKVIWEGIESPETGLIERALKVPPGVRSDQVLIEMDTARVPGWNEIDAVEIVGRDGSRQWAAESTASSYYGQGNLRSPDAAYHPSPSPTDPPRR